MCSILKIFMDCEKTPDLACVPIRKSPMVYIWRTQKYYVSENDYSEELYPPYASGAAYVTNGPTASKLFEASKQVKPFLPMEDIFITGLCADEIAATLLHEPSFKYVDPPNPLNWNHYSSLATAHSMTPDSMDILWDQMTKHIFDLFDLTDSMSSSMSSSYSSEWLDKSIFDLFNWSKESSFESDSSAANSIANKFNSPEVKKEAMNWQSNEVNTDSWKDKGASPRPNKTPSLFDALFRNPLMDTGSLENSLRSPESDSLDSMKWPPFPFFPFGLGKPNLNITYFVLKKKKNISLCKEESKRLSRLLR
ncbi:beta-1,3-galactosyltransferase 5 [Caerostris extrusa]|uniref:Hexosyltransferase n=1 Tax=Caerostris extrusa TaxID=172846 RepID=A0AAV4NUN4_CAEEX|nr:beta-1,3-galactosyltransferase 5 [Caerostris extrusa]